MISQFDGEFEIMDTVPDQEIKYSTIVIDPPWMERGGGKIKRGADKHYELLDAPGIVRTIIQSPVWKNVDDHAHMYLWVTNSFLPYGLEVMKALGFRYITNIAWVKNQIGLGQYFRGKHELCLFGTKGRGVLPRTEDRTIPSIIEAKKTGHSRKPDAFYRMVEKRSHGPYVDMFSRKRREGWVVWGNDIEDEE